VGPPPDVRRRLLPASKVGRSRRHAFREVRQRKHRDATADTTACWSFLRIQSSSMRPRDACSSAHLSFAPAFCDGASSAVPESCSGRRPASVMSSPCRRTRCHLCRRAPTGVAGATLAQRLAPLAGDPGRGRASPAMAEGRALQSVRYPPRHPSYSPVGCADLKMLNTELVPSVSRRSSAQMSSSGMMRKLRIEWRSHKAVVTMPVATSTLRTE
jgi:hypothetical protein